MTRQNPKSSHVAARIMLAKQRQMTSLVDKEIIADSQDMVFSKTDWVPLYFDRDNCVVSDCGKMTAYRAATLKGKLLWLVFTDTKTRGYHAQCSDPFQAMDKAQAKGLQRRAIKQDWAQVEQTASDLLTGRQRFDVRIEDVYASPLCALGIEGFRAAIGMARFNKMPGWMAALFMKIEPQMGFAIHAAARRHNANPATVTGAQAADM